MARDMLRFFHCIAIISLLLLTAVPGMVAGDGMVIAEPKVHRLLRENRQLAYISVEDDQQTMDLFMNVVALRPGENITILVPLRTNPTRANVVEANDTGFRNEFGFDGIIEEGERQTEGFVTFKDKFFGYSAEEVAKYLLLGGIYKWVGEDPFFAPGTIGGSYDSEISVQRIYDNPGFSVDLATFGTEGSMANYTNSLNLSLPPGIEEVMQKYSTYSIAVINMTTRSPIKEPFYGKLMNATPTAMNTLIEYIADHPVVEVKGEPPAEDFLYSYFTPEFSSIRKSFGQELSVWAQFYNISTEEKEQLTRYFNLFAATMYGYGKMDGYTLSFDPPLFEEKAFFPLGTTVAWNGTDQVEVIFECEGDKEIKFDESPHLECIADGKHYFVYQYTGTQPDHDLEGEYGGEVSNWKEMKFRVNGFFHDDAGMKGIILWGVILIFAIGVFVKFAHRMIDAKAPIKTIVKSVIICIVMTTLLPLWFALLFTFATLWENNKREIVKKAYEQNPLLAQNGSQKEILRIFKESIVQENRKNPIKIGLAIALSIIMTAYFLFIFISTYGVDPSISDGEVYPHIIISLGMAFVMIISFHIDSKKNVPKLTAYLELLLDWRMKTDAERTSLLQASNDQH